MYNVRTTKSREFAVKKFNVTGLCIKEKHYMADISGVLSEIMKMVDEDCYFAINRGGQFGKTITLFYAEKAMVGSGYICISISFEGADYGMFESSAAFCQGFLWRVHNALAYAAPECAPLWLDEGILSFDQLSGLITKLCRGKKVALMIDEVDAASNNHVFLNFLAMLRNKFLARERPHHDTFHSVILAGIYDIKNIKLKMVSEGKAELKPKERQFNSPWNIAADFDVDMAFSPEEISAMLMQYEEDFRAGMDIEAVAEEIYDYTSGHPFLVSRICKYVDEKLGKDWSTFGVRDAVRIILQERNTLFDDLAKNLDSFKNLHDFLHSILMRGAKRGFMLYDEDVNLAATFGYVKKEKNKAVVSNKIFEILMCDYFVSKDEKAESLKPPAGRGLYYEITSSGSFNMELCLRKQVGGKMIFDVVV